MAEQYDQEFFRVTFPEKNVAYVEINRPEKLNAFCDRMFRNLRSIFVSLSCEADVRVILISGAGEKAFTAGLDVQESSDGPIFKPSGQDPARVANSLRRHILDYQDCVTAVERCEKPVITLLHGYSYGMAIDLACATDIRLCVRNAQMCVKEIDIGLAADVGTLSRLPKVVGSASWMKDIALSARVFGADEALQQGFVSNVYETKEDGVKEALRLARTIAEKSPVAAVSTKEFLNYSRDRSVEDGLRYTAVWNAAMLQTEDVRKAILSGLKRKKAVFEKL